MLTKRFAGAVVVMALLLGDAHSAQAQQTLNFTLGGFVLRGPDARVAGDVLVANSQFLTLRVDDFNGATVGGEWLVPLGSFIEFGAGASYFQRTVPSVYRDFVASDGTEIFQESRLRMIPVAFTARVVPTGVNFPVQPYFGAGVALIPWRYSEFGDYVDFGSPDHVVRYGTFAADGTEVGPVVLGGIRFASDVLSVGGEVRYQRADADLDSRFAGPKLDLSGWTYQFTFGFRFGG